MGIKKYRIDSARWQNWDYGWDGAYFITICTKNRKHYFGNIINGQSKLSSIGIIADVFWHEIKNHADNIQLGEFVVMPNHIHGILILSGNRNRADCVHPNHTDCDHLDCNHPDHADCDHLDCNHPDHPDCDKEDHADFDKEDKACLVSTVGKTIGQKRFRNPGKNTISSIVGGYKSAVTKHARRLGFEFYWQPRFWDHVIRNEQEFQRISDYIVHNPQKWTDDKFNGGVGNVVLEPVAPYRDGDGEWMI